MASNKLLRLFNRKKIISLHVAFWYKIAVVRTISMYQVKTRFHIFACGRLVKRLFMTASKQLIKRKLSNEECYSYCINHTIQYIYICVTRLIYDFRLFCTVLILLKRPLFKIITFTFPLNTYHKYCNKFACNGDE